MAPEPTLKKRQQSSLLDNQKLHAEEVAKMRSAMVEREGLIASIFELMRRVPRRLLMILKLADLQRLVEPTP
jgi:aarF domain-containing kinase